MKTLMCTAAATALIFATTFTARAHAENGSAAFGVDIVNTIVGADEVAKKGRGKGGRKPRVPGGSGCDDPGDILEHPECQG